MLRLRAEYEHRCVTTNLYPPSGRPILELDLQRGDKSYMTYWFDDGTKYASACAFLTFPVLSQAISYGSVATCHLCRAILRSDIRPLDRCLEHPGLIEDDSEDVSELVSKLPLVRVHSAKHFLKKGKYRSEIENLTRCQGGSIPGHPLSPHVIQLLGWSADGQLVFEKLSSSAHSRSLLLLGRLQELDFATH